MQIINFWRPLLFPWSGISSTENRHRHPSNHIKSSNKSINKEIASPKTLAFLFLFCYFLFHRLDLLLHSHRNPSPQNLPPRSCRAALATPWCRAWIPWRSGVRSTRCSISMGSVLWCPMMSYDVLSDCLRSVLKILKRQRQRWQNALIGPRTFVWVPVDRQILMIWCDKSSFCRAILLEKTFAYFCFRGRCKYLKVPKEVNNILYIYVYIMNIYIYICMYTVYVYIYKYRYMWYILTCS